MTLELVDLTKTKPLGIVKDVPMKIDNGLVPSDFVVLDLEFNDKYVFLEKAFSCIIWSNYWYENWISIWKYTMIPPPIILWIPLQYLWNLYLVVAKQAHRFLKHFQVK